MQLIQAIILAIVQGITEWLPVSSSGHLAILQHLFNIKENIAYDTLLHFASLIVILIVFYKDILKKKYLLYILIGTIPIAITGFLIKPYIQAIFNNILLIGIMLLVTGILLIIPKKTTNQKLNSKNSLVIGLAQAAAILPGISRSGSTISIGLLSGINKEEAIKFSFLLAIPALLGASILNLSEIKQAINLNMALGFIISIVVGYFSLKLLIKIVKNNKLRNFSWYCFAVGILAIILALF